MKITLQDIIDRLVEQTGTTKKLSEDFLREFLAIIEETLNKDEIIKIKGLGTFKLLTVEERKSVNVQTGEEIIIPSHNKISFTSEKELKAAINKPYSHLETYILSKDGPVDDNAPEEDEEEENDDAAIVEQNEFQSEAGETVEYKPEITTEIESISEIIERQEEPLSEVVEKEEEPLSEVIEEKPLPEVVGGMQEKETCRKKKNCKWVILLIILGLIALLIWLWSSDYPKITLPVKEEAKTENVQVSTPEDKIEENDEVDLDQFSQMEIIDETAENEYIDEDQTEIDSTTPNPNRKPEFEGEYMFDSKFDFRLLDFMQANYPKMKLITYGTPREVELRAGQRLTLVSLEYYGNKQFWVYLYFYNTNIIKNPDNVPAGTIINVPRLDKSLVDPNNQESIRVAREIQTDMLKM